MSLVMEGQEVVILTTFFRDEQGRETLNYLMRFIASHSQNRGTARRTAASN